MNNEGEQGGYEVTDTADIANESLYEASDADKPLYEASDADKPLYESDADKPLYEPSDADKPLYEPSDADKPLYEPSETDGLLDAIGSSLFSGSESQFDQLETPRDSAYFYSGLGAGSDKLAADIAAERGGTTLERQLSEGGIAMPEYDRNDKGAADAWRQASQEYAARASGDVRVITGSRMTSDGIFASVEYPTLKENERVSRILSVDPKTHEETVVFDRANPEQNKELRTYKTSTYEKKGSDGKLHTVTTEYVRFE